MKEIIKLIKKNSNKYSTYEVFSDFVEMAAISYSNIFDFRDDREENYLRIINKYDKEEQMRFAEMLNLLILEMERSPRDVLGEIYMQLDLGDDGSGQYFTPFHISELMVELLHSKDDLNKEIFTLSEPTCGAGGMIIAYANFLKFKGINFQEKLLVEAQDISHIAIKMCYLQMCIIGIPGVALQGNTLKGEVNDVWYTPFYWNVFRRYRKLRSEKAV